ncbi:MAG TPA: PfkB family carbohydrate kinase [Tepidisphaeraceae bacterium]|jgi:rfaE bifunctional protein kinase chain/domain/rfaE bifunctional protein nucleotidyltransferase chain/domain|nr:PfkB family carbohydrate kinase [Tepidisphaeraceae bacterium]
MAQSRKICSLNQLLQLRKQARADAKTVVHCHGCFDIVHPGHIHHLQHARSLGDILIVSVSADTHVNKGVNRPLIPDDLRAASLAALECVDHVYLNPHPTAVELLRSLQPDIYMKGREYEKSHDPRFLRERDAVTDAGGRVIFSSGDIVYSSTALIGSMPRADEFNDEKTRRFCGRYDLSGETMQNLVHRFRGQKVLVIGDYILDRYNFCDTSGVAGEAPMMALRVLERKEYDGGAGVIAMHLAGLGASPYLVTSLADDDLSRQIDLRLRSGGIELSSVNQRRQVITKTRYLVDETKMLKADEGGQSPLDSKSEELVAEQILGAADGAAAVIFADFGYGLITGGLLERVMAPLRKQVPIITADVSGKQSNLLRFKGVDLLCPTEREVRETVNDFSSGLGAVVSKLLTANEAKQAIITLGKQGLVTFDWPMETPDASDGRLRSEYLPALAGRAIDALGCGDALLATASLALASGSSLQAAAMLGSLAAAMEVESIGNVPLSAEKLISRVCFSTPLKRAV